MPKSRTRKKAHYTAPEQSSAPLTNPAWFVPVLVALLVIGLVWIVVTYLTSFGWPVPKIGAWNLAIGFGFALVGLGMATRWH